MSVFLSRGRGLSPVSFQPYEGRDDQGKPSYGALRTIHARAVLEDKVGLTRAGEEVKTSLTLWIPWTGEALPGEQDRVIHQGSVYVGIERREVQDLGGQPSHVRLRCAYG